MSRLLERDRTALLVIDVQEAFRKAVSDFDAVAGAAATLVRGFRVLDLPVVVSEQYPAGLGRTVPEVREALGDNAPVLEKTVFAASQAEGFELHGRRQALVCGIESHVCVNQTVHDLIAAGIEVHVARDAVSSRTTDNRDLGLRKMEGYGAIVTSVETALLELVGRAGTNEFKRIQALIR